MKKIALLIGMLLGATGAQAAEPFLTFLTTSPAASALGGTEIMYCDQSAASTQCTVNQLLTFINANGAPNVGAATGTLSAANGGTGEAGTITGVPYFNGTSAATAASAANILGVLGTVPAANGGTGEAGTITGVPYFNGTSAATAASASNILGALGVIPLANGGNNSTNGSTLATNATGYTLSNVSGNITSGTTGFGENWVGTVNDASAVDGIISYANITCTTCTTGSYLVDWQFAGFSFKIATTGTVSLNSVTAAAGGNYQFTGHGIISSPAAGQIQFGNTNAASPVSQTVSAQGSRGGTDSNDPGGNLTIQSGLGTGNATGSTLALQVPAAGTAGTAQETAYTELSLGATAITFGDSTNNPTGTWLSTGTFTFDGTAKATAVVVTGSGAPVNGMYLPATNSVGLATNSIGAGTIDANQHWRMGNSTSPSIASGACGTGTNGVLTSGNDQAGLITIGAAATATCTITFGNAFTSAPRAVLLQAANAGAASALSGEYISSISTTTFVITGTLASTSWRYWVE